MNEAQMNRLRELTETHPAANRWEKELTQLVRVALDQVVELQSVRTEYGKAVRSIDRMRKRISELTRELSGAREDFGRLKGAQALRPMSEAPRDSTTITIVLKSVRVQFFRHVGWKEPVDWLRSFPDEHIEGWRPTTVLPPDYATARDMATNDELPEGPYMRSDAEADS